MIARMSAPGEGPEAARAEFTDALSAACRGLDLSVSEDQAETMWRHYSLMVAANRHTNLTRITAPAQAAVKHYADSLALLSWARACDAISSGARVLDVGTGAGFPAVPLAVCQPEWRFLAVDSTRKKATFVGDAAAALALDHLSVRHARARELAGHVEPFELVTCRAAGDLLTYFRETRRLIAPGGWVVCYTTPNAFTGLTPAKRRQAERMGFDPPHRHDYPLVSADQRIDRVLAAWQRR